MKKYQKVACLNLSNSSLHYKKYTVSSSCRPHMHRFYEIELIESGSGIHIINGIKHPYQKGTMYLLRPTDLHEIIIEKPSVNHLLQIPVCTMPKVIIELINSSTHIYAATLNNEQSKFYEMLFDSLKEITPAHGKLDLQLSINIVSVIALSFLKLEFSKETDIVVTGNSKVHGIIEYIQGNFTKNISLSDLANHVFLNKNYLSSMFTKYTGITVTEYIRRMRLDYAYLLCLTTEYSSSQIGDMCGYNSASNFLRDFKKRYHVSPMSVRKANENQQN